MSLKHVLGVDIRADEYAYAVDEVMGHTSAARIPEQWVATTCGYCSVGCGMFIGVKGGRAVSVRGNPDHPVNKGLLCPVRRDCPSTRCFTRRRGHDIRCGAAAMASSAWAGTKPSTPGAGLFETRRRNTARSQSALSVPASS